MQCTLNYITLLSKICSIIHEYNNIIMQPCAAQPVLIRPKSALYKCHTSAEVVSFQSHALVLLPISGNFCILYNCNEYVYYTYQVNSILSIIREHAGVIHVTE